MLQNYEKEIESFVQNQELLNKLDFGSLTTFKSLDSLYHILYKTTNILTKQIYIGVRSYQDYKYDDYIGCGIESNNCIIENGFSNFTRSVKKYGYENFIRQNLLFFSSREELLRAETIIVDKEFVNSVNTLNSCLGGGTPPRLVGKENGNYGRRWTDEKKKEISEYFQKNRNTKGANNSRAIKCVLFNIEILEVYQFDYLTAAAEFLNLKLGTMIVDRKHLYKKKFLLFSKEFFEKLSKEELQNFIDTTPKFRQKN